VKLFILGLGYTGMTLARRALRGGYRVGGTVRVSEKAKRIEAEDVEAIAFDAEKDAIDEISERLAKADALLVSLPPGPGADTLPERLAEPISRRAGNLAWIGYLSTVGVYGDHGGAFVDETTPCAPLSERAKARLSAEVSWARLGSVARKPVIVFRLPGIYGPQRNALAALRSGMAKRIVKPGQVFNRIHVEDIASALSASIAGDVESALYNLTDDEPAPPQDVVAYAAAMLGVEPPPEIPFAEAKLSPMAASFYVENKRVRNRLIKRALGFELVFPSYREGLKALYDAADGAP
jgi:nucleoside-diphosphate-sugar epimerase